MSLAALRILHVGSLATLQDRGRRGAQQWGFSESGASDRYAYDWANRLLANSENAAAIEITLGRLQIEFSAPTYVALTGADMTATLNGEALRNWSSHAVKAGDHLCLGYARTGLRAYLAIDGGFLAPTMFGSVSSVARENIGPYLHAPLHIGTSLSYRPTLARKRKTITPPRFIPNYQNTLELHFFASEQYAQFSTKAQQRLTTGCYTICQNSDRMGYQLRGNNIEWQHSDIVSEGIALGSIQVPANGQPIVLLSDRQTIGGYPKIGCVRREDTFQLAQRRPGQHVRFVKARLQCT